MDSDAEIIWTARAKITFYNVLNYLDENWTRKELDQFYKRTLLTINAIRKNPKIFPVSTKNKDIRKAFIDKNNIFFTKQTFQKTEYICYPFLIPGKIRKINHRPEGVIIISGSADLKSLSILI